MDYEVTRTLRAPGYILCHYTDRTGQRHGWACSCGKATRNYLHLNDMRYAAKRHWRSHEA